MSEGIPWEKPLVLLQGFRTKSVPVRVPPRTEKSFPGSSLVVGSETVVTKTSDSWGPGRVSREEVRVVGSLF